jgi:hypothetical protein
MEPPASGDSPSDAAAPDHPLQPSEHDRPALAPSWLFEKKLAAPGYDPDRVYGVTRRFSLATVMVMMAGASLILAGMNAMNVPPVLSGTIVLLCIATAIGQMFLFRGKDPRNASFVVGAVFCGLVPLVIYALQPLARIPDPLRLRLGWAILYMFWGAIFGVLPGYLAGCLVAGVLLVMDLTESFFARWRKAREQDDDPWPAPTNAATADDAPKELGNAEQAENAEKESQTM